MKSNVNENRNRLARKLASVTGIFVLAATALGAGIYSHSLREIDSGAQDSMVLDRLAQASRFRALLQKLNSGQVAEARQFLKIALADDVREANRLAATANPDAVAEVKFTLAEIARDEKAHPECYAVEPPAPSARSMQIARHVAKP